MLLKIKGALRFIFPITFFCFLVLWPSFNLNLTGDDYLGLWRYHYYLDGNLTGPNTWSIPESHWNNISFFFTDYGPQDTFTAIIHQLFGFQPQYYYLFSFIFRVLAACSFFPIVYLLTKNKTAAYCSSLFFAITTGGLQTTDWSFNMPSYLAIAIMNIFLFTYIKSNQKSSYFLFILSLPLLYFCIISQPIRMTFLPLCASLIEIYFLLIKKKNALNILSSMIKIILFLSIIVIIYLTGSLGNSIGAGENFYYRTHIGWHVFTSNISLLLPYFQQGQYSILAYPIAMFGSLIFPTDIIPSTFEILTPFKAVFKILLPLFIFFILLIFILWRKNKIKKTPLIVVPILLGIIWSIYIYISFISLFVKSQFLIMLLGGYSLIILLSLFFIRIKNKNVTLGIIVGLLVVFLSFTAAWVRNPTFLYDSAGRYLILPAAGFTILLGTLLASARSFQNKCLVTFLFFILMGIQMFTTFTYIYHLSTVRGIKMTQEVRQSIPYEKDFDDSDRPIVYYFQPQNSEILHHALLFGFPVIIGFQYNFYNVWHFVYTDNWQEVVDAYKNGSSLQRFSIPVKKVPLTDIYSFQLEGDQLINTTDATRKSLLQQ